MSTTRTLDTAEAYMDSSDPADCGWAYRLTYTDRHQESGPMLAGDFAEAVPELQRMIVSAGVDYDDARIERIELVADIGYRWDAE